MTERLVSVIKGFFAIDEKKHKLLDVFSYRKNVWLLRFSGYSENHPYTMPIIYRNLSIRRLRRLKSFRYSHSFEFENCKSENKQFSP